MRQQQLMALVARGLTNKEIDHSEFLGIHGEKSIRILKQVDAGSRSEAVETIRAHGYAIGV